PFLLGLTCFLAKPAAKHIALGGASALVGLGVHTAFASQAGPLTFSIAWMPDLGATFSLLGDNMSTMLVALSGIVLLVIMIMQQNKEVDRPGAVYGLMLLSIAGFNGVFLAADGLLFYFFWELALIPVYFLCSQWGGERRIPVTFKFFIYTFVGSLMMLAGLIYLYLQTNDVAYPLGVAITESPEMSTGVHSYALPNMMVAAQHLPAATQGWLFLLIFSAFAIK